MSDPHSDLDLASFVVICIIGGAWIIYIAMAALGVFR